MKVLVLGATGMLGQALVIEASSRGFVVLTAARAGADFNINVENTIALDAVLDRAAADLVINAAAMVSIDRCELDVSAAYATNARPVALLARASRRNNTRLIQVSTDHYYFGDGGRKHDEDFPIYLVNEYARTKFAAEAFALTDPTALVLRTNIVGHRRNIGQPSFADWILDSIDRRKPITLFADVFHSPIHVADFSKALFDLVDAGAAGLLNLASRDVISKAEFIRSIARAKGIELDWAREGSISDLPQIRADSLGLDVSRVESILDRKMPGIEQTIARLLADSTVHVS